MIVVSSGDTQPPTQPPIPVVIEPPTEQADASVESVDSAATVIETPAAPDASGAAPPENTARSSHGQSSSRRPRPGTVRVEDAATEPEPPPLLPQHTPSIEAADVPTEPPSAAPAVPAPRAVEPTPPEPPPAPPPAPSTPTLRHVRGELENLAASGGIPRGQVQPRALRAVSSLAQCVERNALARGASAMTSPMVCTVTVNVRDRRVDGVTFSPRSSLTAPCEGAVRSAFSGELPQSEDTEYTVTLRAALTPEIE